MKTTNNNYQKTSNSFSTSSYKYILLAIFSVFVFSYSALGQVTVVGHIFAEVVEAASIYSDAITELSISSSDNSTELDLGKMTVNTGSNTSCDIVVKHANLTSKDGTTIALEAKATNPTLKSNDSFNNRTIKLTGNTDSSKGQSGVYQGSYTIVLAYN